MDCYTQTYPIARKNHECDFCGKQIEKGEKYSRFSWKDGGEFFDRKLCQVCDDIINSYCTEQWECEYTDDEVVDWLCEGYCCGCERRGDCGYYNAKVQKCPLIRKHFEGVN